MARMIDIASPSSLSYPQSPSTTSTATSIHHSRPRPPLLPLFITCDPARDTPSVLKSYLSEFHPSILGLTGTYEQIKQVCKAYRVYFSTPEGVKPGMDYLVDHSIYFYLMGNAFPRRFPFLFLYIFFFPHTKLLSKSSRPRRRFCRSHRPPKHRRRSSQGH